MSTIALRGGVKMKADIEKVVAHVRQNAQSKSTRWCAKYVRLALQAGGAELKHYPSSAKDYGPTLNQIGFHEMFYWSGSVGQPVGPDKNCRIVNQSYEYVPKKGDVVVIQPYPSGDKHGHIAIHTGTEWISDFVQRDMWAGPGYRKNKPSFMAFRQR